MVVGAVAVGVLAADQLSKWWALEQLPGNPIEVIGSAGFRLTFNTGTAFGLGGGYGALVAAGALVVVAGVLVWQGVRPMSRLGSVAVGLILGGAVGNLADRAFRGDGGFFSGAVVDFVDLRWWPVFNIADSAIVIGAILLVGQVALARPDRSEQPS